MGEYRFQWGDNLTLKRRRLALWHTRNRILINCTQERIFPYRLRQALQSSELWSTSLLGTSVRDDCFAEGAAPFPLSMPACPENISFKSGGGFFCEFLVRSSCSTPNAHSTD